MIFLAPVNQQAKRSRNRRSLRMGMLLAWRTRPAKIRSRQKKIVRLWVDIHGFGAKLGCDGFDFAELVRGIFMKNVKLARAGGDKQQPCFRLEDIGVNPGADGQRLENLATVRIHQGQKLRTSAARK